MTLPNCRCVILPVRLHSDDLSRYPLGAVSGFTFLNLGALAAIEPQAVTKWIGDREVFVRWVR